MVGTWFSAFISGVIKSQISNGFFYISMSEEPECFWFSCFTTLILSTQLFQQYIYFLSNIWHIRSRYSAAFIWSCWLLWRKLKTAWDYQNKCFFVVLFFPKYDIDKPDTPSFMSLRVSGFGGQLSFRFSCTVCTSSVLKVVWLLYPLY